MSTLFFFVILARVIMFLMETVEESTNTRRDYSSNDRTANNASPANPSMPFVKMDEKAYIKWLDQHQFVRPENEIYGVQNSMGLISKVYTKIAPLIDFDATFFAYFIQPTNQNHGFLNDILRNASDVNISLTIKAIYLFYNKEGYPKNSMKDWSNLEYKREPYLYYYIREMIKFLFERFPVPPSVSNIWVSLNHQKNSFGQICKSNHWDDLERNPMLLLYFHITDGKSLNRAQNLGITLPFGKNVAKYFLTSKEGFLIVQNYWWAVAKAEGLNDTFARGFAYLQLKFDQLDFWRTFLQFAHQNKLDNANIDWPFIVNTIQQIELIKFGTGPLNIPAYKKYAKVCPEFNFKGRKWHKLLWFLKKVIDISYPKPEGIKDSYLIEKEGWFKLERLRTQHQLMEEGKVMNHCVGDEDYHYDCLNGNATIWSLKKLNPENGDATRLATILMEGNVLSEYGGPQNAELSSEVFQMIQEWRENTFEQNVLEVA